MLFQGDVTRDGQRFLVNSLPPEDAAAPLSLLIDWPALLEVQQRPPASARWLAHGGRTRPAGSGNWP